MGRDSLLGGAWGISNRNVAAHIGPGFIGFSPTPIIWEMVLVGPFFPLDLCAAKENDFLCF